VTTGTPISPRLVKGGIVTMDPDTSVVLTVISLQYNPDSLTRSLQIQAMPAGRMGCAVDALRLRGPAIETIKVEAEMDAVDQLEFPKKYPLATKYGLHPQLAQLEMLVNPTVETLLADDAMANAGTLESIPLEQAADALCVEQQPRHSRAAYRIQHHRGSLRPEPEPDSRQAQPRHARAERR